MSDSAAFFKWVHYHPAEAECACDCLARSAAFAAGVEVGQSMDMYAMAVEDMTHLGTMVNDRRTVEALGRMTRFMDWAVRRVDGEFESLEPSTYWPTT